MGLLPAIAIALIAVTPADRAAATGHYNAGLARGQELRFLWMPETDLDLTAVVKSQVVASSRTALIDGTVPQHVPGTNMLAIDLNALAWRTDDWQAICGYEHNGYTSKANPLIVPAGWFLNEVADGRESNAYLRFVFSGKVPKTEDDFLKAFGIDRKAQGGLQYGQIEGQSGVNKTPDGARLLEHSDGTNAEAFVTYDVRKVAPGSDPLEGLFFGGFKHDASEFFVLAPKVSTQGVRGVFPFVGLADGAGRLVTEAPTDIVEDGLQTFGDAAIVAPGSCTSCHSDGPQRPSVNALRDRLKSGVELKTYSYGDQVKAELFHLGSMTESLDRWERDYTAALKEVNNLIPKDNATAFRLSIRKHLEPLTLERAAAELSCEPRELQLALGHASASKVVLNPRVAGLAHGKNIGRDAFEASYLILQDYLQKWRSNQ